MKYVYKILILVAADATMGLIFAALAWPLAHAASADVTFLQTWMAGVGLRQLVSVSVAAKD